MRKLASRVEDLPEKVKEFLFGLGHSLRSRFPDSSVHLTGSYSRGDWLEDSDVDLVVIAKEFEGMDLGRRYKLVKQLSSASFSLEVLAYTPEEFRRAKNQSVILKDMMRHAKKIS